MQNQHLKENKVFGVGFSKTGTTSLEQALIALDLNVCPGHWQLKHNDYNLALYCGGLFDELQKMTKYWDAFADGPWGGTKLYEKLVDWYPDAYFVHTIRDPEAWYDSLVRMIHQVAGELQPREDEWEAYHRNQRYGSALFFNSIFGGNPLENKNAVLSYYNRLNDSIHVYFSKSNFRYIQMDITKGDGWNSLCPFLDIDVPTFSFPHHNKGQLNKPDPVLEVQEDNASNVTSSNPNGSNIFKRVLSSLLQSIRRL